MTNVMRTLGMFVTVGAVTVSLVSAQGAKAPAAKTAKPIDLSKFPAPVRATIEAEAKGATVKSVSKETEQGKTEYEVETIVDGRTGFLVDDLSAPAFADAIARAVEHSFDRNVIRAHAERFSRSRFGDEMAALIDAAAT